MREIELKVLNVDKQFVRRFLKESGARRVFGPVLVREIHFRNPRVKRPAYTLLRLRSLGKVSELTIKTRKRDTRFIVHKELEVEVSNFAVAERIIETLGFRAFRLREKIREEYRSRWLKFEIDQYPNLNPYLEIEGSKKRIKRFLEKFGVSISETVAKAATEVIKDARLNPNHLVF